MKVSGYVTAVEHWQTSTGKDKMSVVLDNDKKYPFWVQQRGKPDFVPPKVGDYIDLEYTDDGKYINGTEWALQRQEPIKQPPPAQGEQPMAKWATLSAKEHLVARENATKNATALVVAEIQAGLLKDGIEQRLEHWFQVALQLLFQGSVMPPAKSDTDIAMEAALAWAANNNIHPDKLDKFVGAYRVNHNLTTLEVLTLLNSGHFDPGVVELAGE